MKLFDWLALAWIAGRFWRMQQIKPPLEAEPAEPKTNVPRIGPGGYVCP